MREPAFSEVGVTPSQAEDSMNPHPSQSSVKPTKRVIVRRVVKKKRIVQNDNDQTSGYQNTEGGSSCQDQLSRLDSGKVDYLRLDSGKGASDLNRNDSTKVGSTLVHSNTNGLDGIRSQNSGT